MAGEIYEDGVIVRSGVTLTSRLHVTTHQYVVLSGRAQVLIPGAEPVEVSAGHIGITEAGTRRGLYVIEDCRWVTWHVLAPEEEAARAAGVPELDLVAMVEARILGVPERTDRDVFAEYQQALAAHGLPGPHAGPQALGDGDATP